MRDYLSEKAWVDLFTMEYEMEENYLWSICPTVPSKFHFMGKEIDNPRYDIVYGRNYTFSNVDHIAEPIPISLFPLLEYVNGLGYGVFNQMLINYYMNGHHYIGSHADNEKQLVIGSPIVSISFGGTRTFRIRDKNKKIVKDYELKNKDINNFAKCLVQKNLVKIR